MKAYTDIEQSKKLAEILPIESADMEYPFNKDDNRQIGNIPFVKEDSEVEDSMFDYTCVPCWSLAALLDILSKTAHSIDEDGSVDLCDYKNIEWSVCLTNADVGLFTADNSVDACVKMIIKLHENKIL